MTDEELRQWAEAELDDIDPPDDEHERTLARAVLELMAERDAALAVLRSVEWRGSGDWAPDEPWAVCPVCSEPRRLGHLSDCELAAVLGKHGAGGGCPHCTRGFIRCDDPECATCASDDDPNCERATKCQHCNAYAKGSEP